MWKPIKPMALDKPLVIPSFDGYIRCALCGIPLGQKNHQPAVKAYINNPNTKTSTATYAHRRCPKIL